MKMMKLSITIAACSFLCLAATWVTAEEDLPSGKASAGHTSDSPEVQRYSYAIGMDIGSSFRARETPLHLESLLAGLKAALEGTKPKYDEKVLGEAIQHLQQRMAEKERARERAAGMDNRVEGEEFLASNLKQEGVKATKSGLQYKVIESGKGKTPGPRDVVSCHYRGTLIDGTEFDSSYARNEPAQFPVNRVIPGWTEALQMMKVGDKWQLFIPADLAYGDRPPGPPIKPGSVLVFDIELLGIVGK